MTSKAPPSPGILLRHIAIVSGKRETKRASVERSAKAASIAASTVDGSASISIPRSAPEALGLVVAFSLDEPERIGEICIVPSTGHGGAFVLGRGPAAPSDPGLRLEFARRRAGIFERQSPLSSPRISRMQLELRADGTRALSVKNVGRCPLSCNGTLVDSASVTPGDTLTLGRELVFLCVSGVAWIRPLDAWPLEPFGRADSHGFVGESPLAWELRRQIAFMAPRSEHMLISGESGSGKELVARAVHALSHRAQMPFVARNASTFPEGLVDAELFGHAKNYPNPGMPERQGLIGEASGGTLFLDEIAELPPGLQTHLLRVLDAGEYQRLGEGGLRTSDLRLVAATNRPEQLRTDLAARLKLSLCVPSLNERLEDVPLLLVHLLRTIGASNPDVAARLFPDSDLNEHPRIAPAFVEELLRRGYKTHVRELEARIWEALAEGPEHVLGPPQRSPAVSRDAQTGRSPKPLLKRKPVSLPDIRTALLENEWNLEHTWRALGLSSRHALARLMAKHGLRRPKE